MSPLLIWVFVGLGAGLLVLLQASHVRKVKRERGALFDGVAHLFADAEVRQDGIDYPTLTGRYRGYPVKLEAVVDSLAFRKLPVLWLVVTHRRPLDVAAPLDILLGPTGTEFFSPNGDYRHDVVPDPAWPEHVRVASPDPGKAPPVSTLRQSAWFIADPSTKEVLVTGRGIRVVRRLAESDQALYRVTRRADLGPVELPPERLLPVLTALAEVGDALTAKTGSRERG